MKKLDLEIAQLRNFLGLANPPALKWIAHSKSKFSSLSIPDLQIALRERQDQRLNEHLFGIQRDLKRLLKKIATLDALNSTKKGKESQLKTLDLDVESNKLMQALKKECEIPSDPPCENSPPSLFAKASAFAKWKREAVEELKAFVRTLLDQTPKEQQEEELRLKRKVIEEANSRKRQLTSSKRPSQPSQEKKNRPGQRARRLEWERLHGNEANHLKVEEPVAQKKELHPSWSAKIAQQQKASEVSFVGKKVVFADDE